MKHFVCTMMVLLLFVGYIQSAEPPAVVTITEYNGGFCSAAFSPDGTKIVTGAKNKTACVWDATTGQKLLTLQHVDRVRTATFSPDGKKIATSSDDGIARIWDTESGKELHKLEEGYAFFSLDGKNIVTVEGNKEGKIVVRIRDAESRKELHQFAGTSPLFSPDGKKIITIDSNEVDSTLVRIWDVESGKKLQQQDVHPLSVQGAKVAFSPDGEKVITNAAGAVAHIWNTESGKKLQQLAGHFGHINAVAFSPDGKKVITASDDEIARIWDAETGKELQKLQGKPKIREGWDWQIGEYERVSVLEDGKWILRETRFDVQFKNAVFSPDSKYVLTIGGREDRTARIWDAETGKELRVLRGHEKDLFLEASFSPDGTKVVTQAGGFTVRIWDWQRLPPQERPVMRDF